MFPLTVGQNALAAIDYMSPDPGSDGGGSGGIGSISWLVIAGMVIAIWWVVKVENKASKKKEGEFSRMMQEEKEERAEKARLAKEALAAKEQAKEASTEPFRSSEDHEIYLRLVRLEELKHEGLITEDEYRTKRQSIMDRL